ncbi:amidohydrolase [Candidatus Entotheonella serta]|nr:amidohydrolase [Candidatus Entotheonella serta]
MSGTDSLKVIRGGHVLDIDKHQANLADVLIRGNHIAEIIAPGAAVYEQAEIIDAGERLLMPGLINAHTHSHGGLAKGSGDRWTLELLLNASSWLSAHRTAEHMYLSSLVGALEMVRKGCTACYDLYLELPLPSAEGVDAVSRAYRDVGMRTVVAPMTADHTFYQAIPGLLEALPEAQRHQMEAVRMQPGKTIIAACRSLLDQVHIDRSQLRLALAPTIPLHCTDDLIVAHHDLARDYDVGLHMHLAESKVQAVSGVKRYGKSLTAHLDDLGFLGPNFTAAHGVWLDADDIQRLADRGASVAHNAGSNLRLGSGIAAAYDMVQAGVNVGIGTDGANCSDNQNMFEAMRFASFVSRVRSQDYERWLQAEQVLRMATAGSAKALGFGDDIGCLEPGYKADIVFLDLNHVNYLPLNDPTHQLVHTEDGSAVDSVMIDGNIVLSHGQFQIGIDLASLRSRLETARETLTERTREARQLAEALEPHVGRFCVGLARQPHPVQAALDQV